MVIEITPPDATETFVDYLRRLGCTVELIQGGRVSTFVTFPQTVDDERSSLREWCGSWSRGNRRAVCIEGTDTV